MSYSTEVLADGPIGYWRLGEASGSTTVADSSGVGRTGTLHGAAVLGNPGALPTDPTATCLRLTGASGTYVSVSNASALPTTGPCTIEGWINIQGTGGSGFHALLTYGAPSLDQENGLIVQGTTQPFINWWADDYSVTISDMSGVWHHLVYTYDGTRRQLYADGVLIGQQLRSSLSATSASLALGTRIFNGDLWANAYLQDLAIYDTSLSSTRIAAHYAAGGTRPSIYTVTSTAGEGKGYVLGSEPTGWKLPGFDDSAWHAIQAQSGTTWPTLIGQSHWITDSTIQGAQPPGLEWLYRRKYTLSIPSVLSATLQVSSDNQVEDVWVNGTHVFSGLLYDTIQTSPPEVFSIDPSLFIIGAENVLAVKVRNTPNLTFPDSGPTSLDYGLLIAIGGGAEHGVVLQIHIV